MIHDKNGFSCYSLMPVDRIIRGTFVRRPNRFVVICNINGEEVPAYMPNPGRLWELLYVGVTLILSPSRGGKMDYTVMAIDSARGPILLHTHLNNNVARWLLDNKMVPGLEDASVVRAEYPFGDSRFDFLMKGRERKILVEVKSCTLFKDDIAMFPDAVTDRGTKHLRELEEASHKGWDSVALILAHSGAVRTFMPEYHTDLNFARTMLKVRDSVEIIPLGLTWDDDLRLSKDVNPLDVPWELLESEAEDRGSYLILLQVESDRAVSVGALGEMFFRKGFYVYVGSAMENLQNRMNRHSRLRKRHHWHIDYLRQESRFLSAMAIRSSKRLECTIAQSMSDVAEGSVARFGSSDCNCESHLFYFSSDPRGNSDFIDLLLYFRMTRLNL